MLAKENRVLSAADFKSAVRRGKRVYSPHAVIYLTKPEAEAPTRFGFIVGKNVGGAVQRNLVRRRLRSIARELLPDAGEGRDVVVRALPGVDQLPWDTLQSEIAVAIDGAKSRNGSERR
ncbi:ribonuclease P protein component [Conyzicola lurida]|uniref:Ribonuclease P protein component n=1 Tax=Conyzicola lurida TaxID=1172621 RepID=A0A841ATI1_9MICO|nr:ribonuclease P protein component [Conyzicola lurida]